MAEIVKAVVYAMKAWPGVSYEVVKYGTVYYLKVVAEGRAHRRLIPDTKVGVVLAALQELAESEYGDE